MGQHKKIRKGKILLAGGLPAGRQGYGGFTYSKSQRNEVIKYIMNQEKHHSKQTFREEYMDLLKKFEIQYDERYLFEFYD